MNQEKIVQERTDMDARYQWRLCDIYADGAAFEADFETAKGDIAACAALAGHVAEAPLAAVARCFAAQARVDRLVNYAAMQRDQDNRDTASQALLDRAESLAVAFESATAFLRPELLRMDESALRALAALPEAADYDAFLAELLRYKPHTLSASEEKLLAGAEELGSAPQNIFLMLTNADMTFPAALDENGEAKPMSEGLYRGYIQSPDRVLRENAFRVLFETYRSYKSAIAAAYAANVKQERYFAVSRGFAGSLQASLFGDEIPVSVYDSLIAAIREGLPALTRYLALRKRALGLSELHLWDLYASIVPDAEKEYGFETAFDVVREGLSVLGEDYRQLLDAARADGWVDVFENRGKTHGAYSNAVYGVHPYVLLNHGGDLDSTFTLAHELGHAMHSAHANAAQPYPKAGYSLFVAEVASTVNEVLLMRSLLEKTTEKRERAALLNYFLEQFRTTVFRQTMFAEFEKNAHEMHARGEALTSESLSDMYLSLNRDYYGAGAVVDDLIAVEWMRIPHFYRSFYVYKYATGFSAAVAIAARILERGAPAVADYKRFLSAGGSVPPLDALRIAGVDMASPEPVRDAMRVFADIVSELEALLG